MLLPISLYHELQASSHSCSYAAVFVSIQDVSALVSSSTELRLNIVVDNVASIIQRPRQVQEDDDVAQAELFLVLDSILHMQ